MTSPWIPQLIMARFVTTVLKLNAAVVAQVPAAYIFPDISPTDDKVRQLTHSHAGGNVLAKPIGSPISQVRLLWDVTAWEPRFSRQALDPLMQAVMAVLTGTETKGKAHRFTDTQGDGRGWTITIDYDSDPVVPLDTTSAEVWAPVRQRYEVFMSPVG